MAIAATQVGVDEVVGKQIKRVWDCVASGNYPDGGEPFPVFGAGPFGYAHGVSEVNVHGAGAVSTDAETATPVAVDYAAGKLVFLEGSTAGTPLGEKTDNEAHITGARFRVTTFGQGR